jgi:uncharacterized membrane protein (TIGR02234 family)
MSGRPGGISKRAVVFAGVLGALAALGTTTRTWIHVIPSPGAINVAPFDVPGSDAASSVAALAIVVLAGSVAAAIAGRFARYVIAVLMFLAGIGIAAAAIGVVLDPMATAATTVGAATGTATVKGEYLLRFWPWVTVAAGAWIVLCSIVLAVAGRGWGLSRKYAAPAGTGTADRGTGTGGAGGAGATGAGTAGSAGAVGAAGAPGGAHAGGAHPTTRGAGATNAAMGNGQAGAAAPGTGETGNGGPANGGTADAEAQLDEIDGWDSLSRGEDPTG